MNFLIVDNETTRQRTLRSILSSLGHRSSDVESTHDPNEAFKILKKKKFQCIFMTMDHPNMNAKEFLDKIKDSSSSRSIPVIVTTAEPEREAIIEVMQAGAKGVLGHPCSVSDVEETLNKVIK